MRTQKQEAPNEDNQIIKCDYLPALVRSYPSLTLNVQEGGKTFVKLIIFMGYIIFLRTISLGVNFVVRVNYKV
jgi:hypothetical protein